MFDRIRSWFQTPTPPDGFHRDHLVALEEPLGRLGPAFPAPSEVGPDPEEPEATRHRFDFAFGYITVLVWKEAVHQVIYAVHAETDAASQDNRALLTRFYAGDSTWVLGGDNDFGSWSERADRRYNTSHSRWADIHTFGTLQYKERPRG